MQVLHERARRSSTLASCSEREPGKTGLGCCVSSREGTAILHLPLDGGLHLLEPPRNKFPCRRVPQDAAGVGVHVRHGAGGRCPLGPLSVLLQVKVQAAARRREGEAFALGLLPLGLGQLVGVALASRMELRAPHEPVDQLLVDLLLVCHLLADDVLLERLVGAACPYLHADLRAQPGVVLRNIAVDHRTSVRVRDILVVAPQLPEEGLVLVPVGLAVFQELVGGVQTVNEAVLVGPVIARGASNLREE
mmetsp:Transcript_99696/g.282368  ORF Transcript_99696/g.282368 Transcript_99696/m.282368 type:complete len:249 (+) Transcript_99696:153-899(+)